MSRDPAQGTCPIYRSSLALACLVVKTSHVEPPPIKVPTHEPLVGPDILSTLLVKSCNYIGALGIVFTVIGCLGLVLGFVGVYDLQIFAFGLSAGVRIVGSVAIAGCLLSAISYGILDFVDH